MNNEDTPTPQESSSPVGSTATSSTTEKSSANPNPNRQNRHIASRRRVSNNDDEFVSASDLSSVLENQNPSLSSSSSSNNSKLSNSSQLSTSAIHISESNLDCFESSTPTPTVDSSSEEKLKSSSSSSTLQQLSKAKNTSTSTIDMTISSTIEDSKMGHGDIPIFATCSSTATSSSGFRRTESWSGTHSVSIDSISQTGSDIDALEDDRKITLSGMNFNEIEKQESQPKSQNPSSSSASEFLETYHTPSTSLHNIVHSKTYSEISSKRASIAFSDETIEEIISQEKEKDSISATSAENLTSGSGSSGGNDTVKKDADSISEKSTKSTKSTKSSSDDSNKNDEKKISMSTKGGLSGAAFSPSSSYEEEDKKSVNDAGSPLSDSATENIFVDTSPSSAAVTPGELTPESFAAIMKDGGSPMKDVALKVPKGRGKPTKKKMWYQQIFSASYKSRSGDFKKLFKELPLKERLLVDYSCALQKEILVQGRMYISQGYLSFHANIFGWETQTSIRFKEITSITKEKTALVIPNAIQVITDTGEKLFFTSFVTRDATFLMVFKLWQSALLEDSLPSKEIQRLIHCSYGEELVITSDDDETEQELLNCKPTPLMRDITDGSSLVSLLEGKKSIVIDPLVSAIDISPALAAGGNIGSSIITSKLLGIEELQPSGSHTPGIHVIHSDITDSSDSDDDFQAAEGIILEESEIFDLPICPVPHTEGRETINAIIPCNIDQLFTMLFTSSKFYLDFHTARKTFNINQSPWEIGKDGKKTRQVAMTVSLNAVMGPKHSQVTETQVMQTVSKPGLFYAIDSESVNAGVPYADTFFVTIHYCLSRISATESNLRVVNQVKYKKSVWGMVKSIIEKNCWAGIEEFYAHLERALKEECTKMILGASPIPSPKITTSSLPRRRPPRVNKRRAPDVPVSVMSQLPRGSLRTGSISGECLIPPSNDGLAVGAAAEGSSWFLKIILSVLGCLLLLNAFLYFKLTRLETTASAISIFPPQSFTFTAGELPQNHQDWLVLLQKQEALHRVELQKWHEILMSALQILHQAETDLEALKLHISSYGGEKYSENLKNAQQSFLGKSKDRQQSMLNGNSEKSNKESGEHQHSKMPDELHSRTET